MKTIINRRIKKSFGRNIPVTFVLLAFLVEFLICFSPANAGPPDFGDDSTIFMGESSELFKFNSPELKNNTLLQSLLKKLKMKQDNPMLMIALSCPEFVKKGSKETDLAKLRVEVLKKAFLKKNPKYDIKTSGKTKVIFTDDINKENALKHRDFLLIRDFSISVSTGSPPKDRPPVKKELEEDWKKDLLERYRKVENKHSFICGKGPNIQEHIIADRDCTHGTTSSAKSAICTLAGFKSGWLVRKGYLEYDIEALDKIHQTAYEVHDIAKEIMKRDPEAGVIYYSALRVQNHVGRMNKAKKDLNYSNEIYYTARKYLPKLEASVAEKDPYCLLCQRIGGSYLELSLSNVNICEHYRCDDRQNVIDHVMALHNFVREYLGLWPVEAQYYYHPICIAPNSHANCYDTLTIEDWKRAHEKSRLDLHGYGAPVPSKEDGKK